MSNYHVSDTNISTCVCYLMSSSHQPCEIGIIIILILQMRKLEHISLSPLSRVK